MSDVHVQSKPDTWEKLARAAQGATLDVDSEQEVPQRTAPLPLYHAAVGGRRVPIIKTLLTSACERDCAYCPFRAGRDTRRLTFRPDEFAVTASEVCQAGLAQGILLSSGIAGGSIATQDRLLDTARLLREKYQFRGYLHLKLMPGAEEDQIVEAMRWADRVSVNLEAPGEPYLSRLAPHKAFWDELFQTLQRAEHLRRTLAPQDFGRLRWPSLVTQFVVGAVGEPDKDLLTWSERLVRELRLVRVYYSPFRPIPQTPLEHLPPEHVDRVQRLYKAFYLLRDYKFRVEDLTWDEAGNLLPGDPKVRWAEHHLAEHPVEINTAPRHMLLRVPSIGPKRADIILRARRVARLRDVSQLRALGLPVERMAPYVLLDGRRPSYQKGFFGESSSHSMCPQHTRAGT